MKNPRYPIFTLATVVICVSCILTILYIFPQIMNGRFFVFWGIIIIISAICIMSLFIVVNSLIVKLANMEEKQSELNRKIREFEIDQRLIKIQNHSKECRSNFDTEGE